MIKHGVVCNSLSLYIDWVGACQPQLMCIITVITIIHNHHNAASHIQQWSFTVRLRKLGPTPLATAPESPRYAPQRLQLTSSRT